MLDAGRSKNFCLSGDAVQGVYQGIVGFNSTHAFSGKSDMFHLPGQSA